MDILNTWVNDTSVCQAAERRGSPTFGHFFDYTPSCPESMIRAAVQGESPWFVEQVQALLDGNWKAGEPAILPLDENNSWFGEWGKNVPENVRTETERVIAEIQDGTLDPFAGPIKDQDGKVRVKEGETIDQDTWYAGWDWYVQGVSASGG